MCCIDENTARRQENNCKTATVACPGSKSATASLGLGSEKCTGGVLILVDDYPDEEAEFVKFEGPAAEPVPGDGFCNSRDTR
jgi:hypothetical protein